VIKLYHYISIKAYEHTAWNLEFLPLTTDYYLVEIHQPLHTCDVIGLFHSQITFFGPFLCLFLCLTCVNTFFLCEIGCEWIRVSPTRMVEEIKSVSIILDYNTVFPLVDHERLH
jgi:hypothetical protein